MRSINRRCARRHFQKLCISSTGEHRCCVLIGALLVPGGDQQTIWRRCAVRIWSIGLRRPAGCNGTGLPRQRFYLNCGMRAQSRRLQLTVRQRGWRSRIGRRRGSVGTRSSFSGWHGWEYEKFDHLFHISTGYFNGETAEFGCLGSRRRQHVASACISLADKRTIHLDQMQNPNHMRLS
ncbi:hypothetical protein SAMN05444385_10132 [Tritonibacter mobilis]|nr:hypothetical protein SAMN05444385_10132 [Tritonibacter mobilis]